MISGNFRKLEELLTLKNLISCSRFQIPDSRFQIPDSRFQIPIPTTARLKLPPRPWLFFILSFLTLNTILQSQDCGTVAPSYDILAAYPANKMVGNDGPFYIKIYPVIVRKSDYTEGASEQEVMAAIEIMKANFAPYNIYFNYACIRYHNDTYDYLHPDEALGNYSAPDDGITLLLYNQVPSGNAGLSGIPSRKLWAYMGSSTTLSHEMGHALGLYHTHNSTACSNWPDENEYVDGTECATRGDYVCDTDAAPNFATTSGSNYSTCVFSNSSCVDPASAPYVNADMKNLMSYGGNCREYFENGQGVRMRNTLALDPILAGVQRNWAYVIGTSTIDDPQYADIDVIVTEGSTLNFSNTLELAPEIRIIVEPDARFNGTDAIFTIGDEDQNCPSDQVFWGGFHISSGTPFDYGLVYLEGCTLQHAKTGLTWLGPSYNTYNGRFRIRNSQLINNETAIHLTDRFANTINGIGSAVFGSVFDIDENYLGDEFDHHIYLEYARQGVSITDSEFKLTNTSVSGDRFGIRTFSSRVAMVDNNLSDVEAKLSNFERAVVANRGTSYNPAIVFRNVDFDLNTWGIDILSLNNLNVQQCLFNVPNTSGGFAGIGIRASTGFIIFDNDFTSAGTTVANKYGIRLNQTTTASNVVYENMFNNMGTANLVSGTNGGPMSGLQFLCNTVTNSNQHDFYINPSSTVAISQGTPDNPAGNKFTLNQSTQAPLGSDIYNAPINTEVKYYYYEGDALQIPGNIVNIDDQGRVFQSGCLYRDLLLPDTDTLGTVFNQIQDEYDSLTIIFNQTVDVGTRQIIASHIRDADIRMNIVCNAALQLIHADTVSIDWQATREWLDRKNSFYSDIEIATTYLAEHEDSLFHVFVSSIPGRRTLSAEDSLDYDLFTNLTDIVLDAKAENRAESELDSLEVEALEDIATVNDRMIAGMAKGILETFYGYSFTDTITMRSIEDTEGRIVDIPTATTVFPNPFTDVIHFQFPYGTYDLRIINLMGAIIDQVNCADCSDLSWRPKNLPTGLYGYKLVSLRSTYSGLILKQNP